MQIANQTLEVSLDKMVFIDGGKFLMGSDKFYPEEKPVHEVTVDGYYMDKYEVTNEEFKKFVDETAYITVAERPLDPKDYPGADPKLLVPGALVFQKAKGPVDLKSYFNWWAWVPGANWKHPQGPGSSLNGKEKHPITFVAYEDAEAYAKWAGKQLPTEAEWEYAAKYIVTQVNYYSYFSGSKCRVMKKQHVSLAATDRTYLTTLLSKGTLPAKMFRRATALLELDRGKTERAVAETLGVCYQSVHHWAQTYKQKGLKVLQDDARSGRPPEISGKQRAKITALACSTPPEGHRHWSLRLIAEKVVELGYVEHLSHNQAGKILKKTNSSRT